MNLLDDGIGDTLVWGAADIVRYVGISTNQYQSTIEFAGCMSYVLLMQVLARSPDARCDARKAGSEERMKENRPLVSVVDDDESVRESLPDLLREFGFAVQAFSSAEDFLASDYVNETKCLILDIAMPGISGPDLQRELKLRHQEIPIVFITARREDTVRALMLERGAVECLFKPFSETVLLDAINLALKSPE
jgi:CheY-like chemotaxis protein